jgi:hypothetical protein
MQSGQPTKSEIISKGTAIYLAKYRDRFEREFPGQFAAIDIATEEAFIDEFPERALRRAKSELPTGIFFLVRVGSQGAFKVSRMSNAHPRLI